jgi:hypothetical protein
MQIKMRTRASSNLTSRDTFLAIDDYVFCETSGISRGLCEAVKHRENPLIPNDPNGPDAQRAQVLGVGCVEGQFQMWYLAQDARNRWYTCYAESRDGYHWVKPELGLVERDGSTRNNIILYRDNYDFILTNIHVDLDEPDLSRRYVAPVYGEITAEHYLTDEDCKRYAFAPSHPCIRTFATSADGIHWTEDPTLNLPLRKKIESGALFKKDGIWFMAHQMIVGEYPQISPARRYLGVSYSKDFRTWQFADEPGFYFDLGKTYERTVQTHVTPAILNYGNVVVGVEGIFYDHSELYKEETDLVIILTNDGFHWRQPIEEQPFDAVLRRGNAGDWDHSFLIQGGLVNTNDKTLVYYSATDQFGNLGYLNRQIGVAELPRDRFGYLTPSVGWGYHAPKPTAAMLVTHPILIERKGLYLSLNARGAIRPGDQLKVELQDESGQPISGYTLADCENIMQDGLDIPVQWAGRQSLDQFEGKKIRVKYELVGANFQQEILACTQYPRIFAFNFRKSLK